MRSPWLCLSIVLILGLVCLSGVAGMIWLAAIGKVMPESLIAIVAGSAGSLSSFLVMPPKNSVGIAGGKDSS